ncbi:MAG: glycosyltransferase family 4 protein [Candidatus Latescibacterota bacterium]
MSVRTTLLASRVWPSEGFPDSHQGVLPVHVAHVVPTDRIAYLLLRGQLALLQEAGFRVSVLCGDVGYAERLSACGLRVVHVPFARGLAPRTDLRCLLALHRELCRGGYVIAHSHNPKGTLLGPVAARLAGVPVVVHTVHGLLFHDRMGRAHRAVAAAAERWCAAWCHHLLFQSAEDHAYACAHRYRSPGRLHLIGNGIDAARFDPAACPGARQARRRELGFGDGDLVVGMVARCVREKGYEEFAAMAGRIALRFPQARFLVVGITEEDQSDAVDPAALLRRAGVADRCRVLEQRSDMPELYASMDLAVLPSHREGIPRALMEAAAMGVPVAAAAIRGCREVVEDGRSGVLFGVRDVDSFTAAVSGLLADPERRRRLGTAARQRILERFTEAAAAARLIACYRSFLSG